MTPDPSVIPTAVWVTGLDGGPQSSLVVLLCAVVVGLAVVIGLLSGLLVTTGARR